MSQRCHDEMVRHFGREPRRVPMLGAYVTAEKNRVAPTVSDPKPTLIVHVRKRLAPRGGSEFYRDRSVRAASAFCGGPLTAYDIPWAERNRLEIFENFEGREHVFRVCAECRAAVAKEGK